MSTERSKQERRNAALERAKTYVWSNSKALRLEKGDKPKWEQRNADHISHLESLKTRA